MSNGSHKPFNDVIAHKQNIEGYPKGRGGKLPLPIKIIGYVLFGSFFLMMLIGVVGNILFN
ncbi:hypothetical protein EQV77_06165 [Halobacillus fulvus]|nr:hypothetical protein EQV77_06165 [Halobacillus fulvus]